MGIDTLKQLVIIRRLYVCFPRSYTILMLRQGFITSVRLENMNTLMEFSNTTGSSQQVALEIPLMIGGHGAYSAMSNGE